VVDDNLLLFFVFLALVISQFVYYQNITLGFLFWLFLGAGAATLPAKERKFKLREFPEMALVCETIFVVLALFFLVGCFYGVKFYLADVWYVKALFQPDLDQKTKNLVRAINLNPYQPRYRMVFSRVSLSVAQQEILKPQDKQDTNKIQQFLGLAINQAKRATTLAPNQVVAWQNLASVYRNSAGLVKGAEDWGIKAYQRAQELEPKNPMFHTEAGKLYLILKKNQEAQKEFEKATELKSDYLDAHIQIALLKEKEGKTGEAKDYFIKLLSDFPLSSEAHFQLGRLYFNEGEVDKAIDQFQTVIQNCPNH
jgi:tetratricopeptide (TPR) repeat protein